MNSLKLLVLIIGTFLLIEEALSIYTGHINYYWEPRDVHTKNIQDLGKKSVDTFNQEHGTDYKFAVILNATSRIRDTKEYNLIISASESCKNTKLCFHKLVSNISKNPNTNEIIKIDVTEEGE